MNKKYFDINAISFVRIWLLQDVLLKYLVLLKTVWDNYSDVLYIIDLSLNMMRAIDTIIFLSLLTIAHKNSEKMNSWELGLTG